MPDDTPGTDLVHVPRSRFHMSDPRVTVRADVEPIELDALQGPVRHTSTAVELVVSYDVGTARVALMDLDEAYRKVRVKLEQALIGERQLQRVGTRPADPRAVSFMDGDVR